MFLSNTHWRVISLWKFNGYCKGGSSIGILCKLPSLDYDILI